MRKRDGRTIAYEYDALNRVTGKTYPGGGARAVYYAYDLRGLQTAARFDSPSGADAVTSTWDGLGRQASSTTAIGGTSRALRYNYNANGQRSRITYPDENYVNYHRYVTGQFHYSDVNGSVPLFHTPLDTAGRVQRLYGWNASVGNWGPNIEYGYDGLSRVSATAQTLTGVGWNVTTGFSYNPASQIVNISRSNDGYAFSNPAAVNRDYGRNGLNQYTSAGDATFAYDDNGNLTFSRDPKGATTYTYDIENRLTAASNGAGLVYDPLGRLYQTSVLGGRVTRFLYDGDALVGEYDASGAMQKRYVHGDGEDDPLVQYVGPSVSNPNYLYANHQGSIIAITDRNGNPTQINSYDEYGIPGSDGRGRILNSGRFQYTGQAWLPELGMYHYKARIYSPTLGRFLQTDPIGYDDQVNLYAYVANDPVNGRDPTGMFDCQANPSACGAAATTAARVAATVGASTALAGTTVVTAPLLLSGDTPKNSGAENVRVYVTYTKTNKLTKQVYSGRSSMMVPRGTPITRGLGQKIVDCRECGHHVNEKGFGPAQLDKLTTDYDAIRGREQNLINYFGGAKSMGGTSGNQNNGIWVLNPNRVIYLDASSAVFGNIPNNSQFPTGLLPW